MLSTVLEEPFPKHSYMLKWEQVLGHELSLEIRQIHWSQAHKSSSYTTYKENAYEILMHWYYTPELSTPQLVTYAGGVTWKWVLCIISYEPARVLHPFGRMVTPYFPK